MKKKKKVYWNDMWKNQAAVWGKKYLVFSLVYNAAAKIIFVFMLVSYILENINQIFYENIKSVTMWK